MDASLEIGLKTQIRRQVGLKEHEHVKGAYYMEHLIKAWKIIINPYLENPELDMKPIHEMIWSFIESSPTQYYKKDKSENHGVYSIIKEYTNKKGQTSLAHYSINNYYLGSVKSLGDKPISYDGLFPLNKRHFKISMAGLRNFKSIQDLFESNKK